MIGALLPWGKKTDERTILHNLAINTVVLLPRYIVYMIVLIAPAAAWWGIHSFYMHVRVRTTPPLAVDDHGEMRVDAQNWAAVAIETKSDEREISRSIKVTLGGNKITHAVVVSCL